MVKRFGDEPLWKTVNRVIDGSLQLRAETAALATRNEQRRIKAQASPLPLF